MGEQQDDATAEGDVASDAAAKEAEARTSRPGVLSLTPLAVLISAAVVNIAGLVLVYEPYSVFRCLNPVGEQRVCIASDVRESDTLTLPDLEDDGLDTVASHRYAAYLALREYAPEASYVVSGRRLHIWDTSPVLLTSLAQGDVQLVDDRISRAAEEHELEPGWLPDGVHIRADIASGSTRFRIRLGEGQVSKVFVFDVGRTVVMLDARLMPDDLLSIYREADELPGGQALGGASW